MKTYNTYRLKFEEKEQFSKSGFTDWATHFRAKIEFSDHLIWQNLSQNLLDDD